MPRAFRLGHKNNCTRPRADCDAPCFEQLKAIHLRASPKQQAMLDVLLQLIKKWPLTIGLWTLSSILMK